MRQLPKQGEIYKHFKGDCYRIITLARHSETGELLVIYQALYGDNEIYARELSMFMGPVDKRKYPNVSQKRRFELLNGGSAEPVVRAPGEEQITENGQVSGAGNGSEEKQEPEAEGQLDPMLLAFLDANSCKERLQILSSMKERLTDEMINTMAIAIDVEVGPGDIIERYEQLKYCLATRERFEGRRLR